MNYIKSLESEVRSLRANVANAEAAITDFRVHLTLPKFHRDTTIQTTDVNRWLDNIAYALREEC